MFWKKKVFPSEFWKFPTPFFLPNKLLSIVFVFMIRRNFLPGCFSFKWEKVQLVSDILELFLQKVSRKLINKKKKEKCDKIIQFRRLKNYVRRKIFNSFVRFTPSLMSLWILNIFLEEKIREQPEKLMMTKWISREEFRNRVVLSPTAALSILFSFSGWVGFTLFL